MAAEKCKIRVAGMVITIEFQKSKSHAERLHKSFPNDYEKPEIFPMLNVEWTEYLMKLKRQIGGKLWELNKSVVVFVDDKYVGDDGDFMKYIMKFYKFGIVRDFTVQGQKHLMKIIDNNQKLGRKYVYLTIAVNAHIVGSLLFLLFADLVPRTCELFLRRVKRKHGSYLNAPIHRIVKAGWAQCGGYKITPKSIPCENYIIPHDRRGVLSMSNSARNRDNSTQFNITFQEASWMDYRYVAFGHLIHGEDVLQLLENIPTHYQAPTKNVTIIRSGEYGVEEKLIAKDAELLKKYLETKPELREDLIDPRDSPSESKELNYKRGFYFLCTDLKSNLPFLHLPDYLTYLCSREFEETAVEEYPEDQNVVKYEAPKIMEKMVSSTSLLKVSSAEKDIRRMLKYAVADLAKEGSSVCKCVCKCTDSNL